MSTNERDTHFVGFAKLLMDDLIDAQVEHYHDNNREDFITTLIAQRAYDLIYHGLKQYPLTDEEAQRHIARNFPDLTEWPTSPGSA